MRLVGKHGDIIFDNDKGLAIIKSPILQRKYGEQVEFNANDLIKWIGRLKINGTDNGRIQFGQW